MLTSSVTDSGWRRLTAAVVLSAKEDFDKEYKKLNYFLHLQKTGGLRNYIKKNIGESEKYTFKKDGISAAKFLASHRGNRMIELYLGMLDLDLPEKLHKDAKDFCTKLPVIMRVIDTFIGLEDVNYSKKGSKIIHTYI